jgi:hypothetical protein
LSESVKGADERKPPLFAEAKAGDELAVAIDIAVVEIAKLPAALPNKHQQPAPGVIVVLVRLEVGRQVLDAFGKNRNLDFRGPRIACVDSEALY